MSDILIPGIVTYIVLIFVITVHECAHAWAAYKCGDPTAKYLGRVSLSPFPHISLIGTVLIPLFQIFAPVFGFGMAFAIIGWGKPVPVNPRNFRNYSRDDVLVSLAGPVANLLMTLGAILMMELLALLNFPHLSIILLYVLIPLTFISFILFFFNMLPIPPLDGSHLLRFFLNYEAKKVYDSIAEYGFFIILIMINLPITATVFDAAFTVLDYTITFLAPHALPYL
jgi:Zn-dependent protease